MLKSLGRDDEFGDGWDNMPLNFGLLTWDTLPSPLAYILFDVWPDKLFRYGLTRPLDSGMAEAMNNIKYPSSVGKWNEGPRGAVRDVDKEISGTHFDFSERQTCPGISSQVSQLWIQRLLPGHVL